MVRLFSFTALIVKGALSLIVVRSSKVIKVKAYQQSKPSFLVINARSVTEAKPHLSRTYLIARRIERFGMVLELNLVKLNLNPIIT